MTKTIKWGLLWCIITTVIACGNLENNTQKTKEETNSIKNKTDFYSTKYSNGLIRTKGIYVDYEFTGWIEKYDSITGLLEETQNFAFQEDFQKNVINMWLIHNDLGEIDSLKGHYLTYEVIGNYDTLRIYSMMPLYGEKVEVSIGGIDNRFKIINPDLVTNYDIDEYQGRIPLHGTKKVTINDIVFTDTLKYVKPIFLDLEKHPCFGVHCD